MESLGEKIKNDLKKFGIKQAFVAEKMNLSKQAINQIDKRKMIDLDFLQKLKEVTGIDYTTYDPHTEAPIVEEHGTLYHKVVKGNTTLNFSLTVTGSEQVFEKFPELLKRTKKVAEDLGFKII